MVKFENLKFNLTMNDLSRIIIAILLILSGFMVRAQRSLSIENKYLKVEASTLGAELQSIRSMKTGIEYLWQGDEEHWAGKAPVMFPVNVKFKDARYTYRGKEYEMPDMGLARTSLFRIADITNEEVSFELRSNAETLAKYPFEFSLKVSYQLIGRKLINRFIVENNGDETMYFALGGHPGFCFPVAGKTERGQNQLMFRKKYELKRTEIAGGLVQENEIILLLDEDGFALNDERIPNAGMFVKNMPSRKIGVGPMGEKAYVEVNLNDFPNVNMWTPPGMPFACIEPMVGHHDLQNSPLDIEQKKYLIALPAGKKKKYSFSIEINE